MNLYAGSSDTSSSRPIVIWRRSHSDAVVWCRTPRSWQRVRRWRFAKPYATVFQGGAVVELGFTIPARKIRFAHLALGLPYAKRSPTVAQIAYYDALRTRSPHGDTLRPRETYKAHRSRYFDEALTAGGAET